MNRQEKQLIIESLKNDFKNSQASFLVGVQGIPVHDVQNLRKGLRKQGAHLRVAKNTFLKIAAQEIPGYGDLAPYFKEQIAVIFVEQEAPAIAKMLYNSAKENEKLRLIAGSLNEKVLGKAQIEFLATLPPKEVMIAHAIGSIKAPITKLVMTLNQQKLKLLMILKQAAQKKQEEGQ